MHPSWRRRRISNGNSLAPTRVIAVVIRLTKAVFSGMGNKKETPATLTTLVESAIQGVKPNVANAWVYQFDRNRVRFVADEREFCVRDRGGDYFTITYGYSPGKITTKHYDQQNSLRLVIALLGRLK